MTIIRTLVVYVYLALGVIFGSFHFKGLEKKKERLGGDEGVRQGVHKYGRNMAQRIVGFTGSRLTVKGSENLPNSGAVLYVVNHQSYMDIPIMMAVVERPIGFIAKEELGKIPFFDQWLPFMKCVLICRNDARKALASIIQASKYLKEGNSLVLFPEGTRSKDGTLGEFKAGSMKAAQKGKATIVPVVLQGANQVMPRGSFWMHKADVTATVLPAISAETVQNMETGELSDLIRKQMAQVLGQTVDCAATDSAAEKNGDELHG